MAPYRRLIRPLDLVRDRVVLLFYEDFDRDRWLTGDRHWVRAARKLNHAIRRKQRVSGFEVWFRSLVTALERSGYEVRVDDEEAARANPTYPVGLVGYPHILEGWSLPNPAVLGPGLYDHPSLNPGLMSDPRFVRYIVSCEWMRSLFAQRYPREKLGLFFGGIDTRLWPDTAGHPKDIDLLIYDKIRWDRPVRETTLVAPILRALDDRGLRHHRLVYRTYDHPTYRSLLNRSRALLFLCESETQGMAYQEALASNVPVLAWDPGRWLDPSRLDYGEGEVDATSVPYFDESCGERFSSSADFAAALAPFLQRLPRYRPRDFVQKNLSFEASAQAYLALYREAAKS